MATDDTAVTSVELELADVAATERLGAQLAELAQAGDVIFLHGELGAGKTSLARGFLRQFFADSALEVPSPSYLICFTYTDIEAPPQSDESVEPAAGRVGRDMRSAGSARLPGVNVLHLDPYRLPTGKVASLIDLAPAFEKHVCLIEWPERLGPQLVSDTSPGRLEVTLGGIGPQAQGRRVVVEAVGERWSAQLRQWSLALGELPEPAPIPARAQSAVPTADDGQDGTSSTHAVGMAVRPSIPEADW